MKHIREWWPDLPKSMRAEIRADPRRPLTAAQVIAIGKARGLVVGAHFPSMTPAPEYTLSEDEAIWVDQLEA